MKKLLSIILACAMIMSLFCVVPASATYNATNQKLPYAFEDFEGTDGTGATGLVASNSSDATVSVVADSARGGHVLKAESANNVQGGPTLISYAYKANKEDTKESFCETFAANEVLSLSAWVKLGTVQASAALRFILFFEDGTNATLDAAISDPGNTTAWEKVSATYRFAAEKTIKKIEMRFHATSTDAHDVVMYVDDLEIKLDNRYGTTLKATTPANVNVDLRANNGVNNYQFGYFQNGMTLTGTPTEIIGYNGTTNKVAQYQYSGNGQYNQEWMNSSGLNVPYKVGDVLEVSMWVKLSEVITADKFYYHHQIGTGNDVLKLEFNGKTTDWQYAEGTLTATADANTVIYRSFTTNASNAFGAQSGSAPKTAAGTNPIIYVDNYHFRAYTPLFEGIKQAPATEKYATNANGATAARAEGANVYYWDSNVTSQNRSFSTTKHDGSTGNVYRLELAASNQNLQQYYINYGGGNKVTLAAGDEVKLSQWIKLETPATADKIYYTVGLGTGKTVNVAIDGKSTDWQYVEATHTISEAIENGPLYHGYTTANTGAFSDIYNANRPKDANGNVPVFQIDDYKLQFFTPGEITTGVTTIPVAEDAVASVNGEGAISATYTLKTNVGAAIDAEADKSFFKLVGESGRVYSSANTVAGLAYPDAATETIKLQIIPATADYVGDVVEVAIIDLSAFNGIEILDADIGYAEISTDTAIENAKLIWVGYNDDTGYIEMTGTANVDVNMDAYTTQQFTDIEMDLGDFTFFKVFLWSDITTAYAPLADYIEY